MGIRAVAFDIGGVLERVDPEWQFLDRWRERLGLTADGYRRALVWPLNRVDPGESAKTGGMTEVQLRQRYAAAIGLSEPQADEFMADMWDWYCGELDRELASYAASLRPRYRTGILSNSVDGARREEQSRYGFEQLVDVVVYSHEIGVAKPDPRAYRALCDELGVAPEELAFLDDRASNVEAACELGIRGFLHVTTAASVQSIDALLELAA